jgi:hypothetical protein
MVYKGRGLLISSIAFLSLAIPAFGQLSIEKECTPGPSGVDATNKDCSHYRLLKEGSNIHMIHAQHARILFIKAKGEFEKSGADKAQLVKDFQKDGTCLPADLTDPNGADHCLDRLKRQEADALASARKNILNNNEGRVEIIRKKDDIGADSLVGGLSSGPGSNTTPTTILKDFRDVASNQKDPFAAQKLLASPQVVNFENDPNSKKADVKIGDALKETAGASGRPKNVDNKDLKDINADFAASQKDDSKIEVDGTSDNTKLNNGLDDARKKGLVGKLSKDDKDLDALNKKIAAGASGGGRNLSYEAFQDVMGQIDKSARDKDKEQGLKPSDDSINNKDALIPVAQQPQPTGKGNAVPLAPGASGSTGKASLDDIFSDSLQQMQ